MSIRRFAVPLAVAIAASATISGASRAQTTRTQAPCPDALDAMAGRPPCFLGEQRIISVRGYYHLTTLHGARIELAPELGVTAEDLEAELQQVLNGGSRKPLPACLVGVGRVHIGTNAEGAAESVTLIAKEPRDADAILARANALMK